LRENVIDPNRIISQKEFDQKMIELAFKSADKSSDWWRQVGAVAVKGKKVLFARYNKHLPSPHTLYENGDPRNNFDAGEHLDLYTSIHAEAGIISEAAKKGVSLEGSFMYTTTFPCPMCAKLIVETGIKKVYYSKGYSLVDAEKLFNQYGIEIILVQ
jgi:dCMP deaminase